MKNFFLLTVLVVTASALPSNLSKLINSAYLEGRIINGEDTPITKIPYQVSIELNGLFHCGGNILNNEWILTAGHCATNPVDSYQVRTGSDTCEYGGQVHEVAEIHLHENYFMDRYGVPNEDIAVFRLKKPIEINERQKPVTLFNKGEKPEVGTYAQVSGYGRTENGRISVTLKSAMVPIISTDACYKALLRFSGIRKHQVCAAYPNGDKDACKGDSGGPLTIGGRLFAMVSWSDGCGIAGRPGVYTEVSKYRDWISNATGLDL